MILPLPLRGTFTYRVSPDMIDAVSTGCRVEVQFGRNKIYSGLVRTLSNRSRSDIKIKSLLDVIDSEPIIGEEHFQFWEWMADYYACSVGEVMAAALPGALKLNSKTTLVRGFAFEEDNQDDLTDEAWLIREALMQKDEIGLDEARAIASRKNINKHLEQLIYKGIVELKEELIEKFKPSTEKHFVLTDEYLKDPQMALEATRNSEPQTNVVLALYQKKGESVARKSLLLRPEIKEHALKALEKKGIVTSFDKEVSRLSDQTNRFETSPVLSAIQLEAKSAIQEHWKEGRTVLLQGVTGSGKTVIYTKLIEEVLKEGQQVLYLLPEIGLTRQIISRMESTLNHQVHVYHSRENQNKRVEVWKAARDGAGLVIGARSSLFLPFKSLGLIIVDEEHDPSFKQQNPSPRYNARDAAVFLGHLTGAKVLLGTATPSLESFFNVRKGKYGHFRIDERFGAATLPEIALVDIKKLREEKKMKGPFSPHLLEGIEDALRQNKQVILFQNRRGYAPSIQCGNCSWTQQCHQCDVSLTLHKRLREMKCHYCNFSTALPEECPACGSTRLEVIGFGTEKIEEELELLLPDVNTARLDYDSTRTKKSLEKILYDFETGRVDVLIGTQMITKGLDFENVSLVGIINADQLLKFPDFRSAERAFQLLVQVGGRAGRGKNPGRVLIQTSNPGHPILKDVLDFDYKSFYFRELHERGKYHYPPFYRNFKLEIGHKDINVVWKAAGIIRDKLREKFNHRILGPAEPMVPRVKSYFLLEFMFKLEKDASLISNAKKYTIALLDHIKTKDPFKSLRVKLDIDPM